MPQNISSDADATALRYAFRAHKREGEPVRRILDDFDLIDHSCKPFADDTYLYFPLLRYPDKDERLGIRDRVQPLETRSADAKDKIQYHSWYLKDIAFQKHQKVLSVSDILGFSVSYEMIGDIAVLDEKIQTDMPGASVQKIAEAVLSAHPTIQTVLLSCGPISGEFRTRDLAFVAGIDKTQTLHKEYGCQYKVDLARAYFTPRLATERHRIMLQVHDGETVIDMFAGVGPYSILIAKNVGGAHVIANDKNTAAIELLKENAVLNHVRNLTILNEDAAVLAEKYEGQGDHILMNLPHNAADFLETAVSVCKRGGIIHYYAMAGENDLFDGSAALIRQAAEKQGRQINILEQKIVRSYAPHQYNICLEARIL